MSVSSSQGLTSKVTTDYKKTQKNTQSQNPNSNTRIYEQKEIKTHLGNGLGLSSLLCVVGSDTLSLDPLSLGILLIVGTEEVNVLIIVLLLLSGGSGSSRGSGGTEESITGGGGAREGVELGLVGLNVCVPAGDVGEDLRLVKSLEDGNVGLGGSVAE